MGRSVLHFIDRGNQQTMWQMPGAIRAANEEAETILVVWDNHSAYLLSTLESAYGSR